MNEDRRQFLEKVLIAAGTLGGGLVAGELSRKWPAGESPAAATAAGDGLVAGLDAAAADSTHAAHPGLMPVLTPSGELIHVDGGSAAVSGMAHSHLHSDAKDPSVRIGVPGRKWVMVIDLAKCDGCGNCTIECNKMHHTPADRPWIRVFRMQDGHRTAPYWFPKPCFHCDNPPCTKVCPVGATFKREDGVVLIDNERCIGCRFCMAACPYSTRFFNWGRPDNSVAAGYSPETSYPRRVGTVEKCDFCPDMAKCGKLPGCVTGCKMGAMYFGDENEDAVTNSDGETIRLTELLEDRAGYRYLEELGTSPRVYYLPPKHREYPKPEIPDKSAAHTHPTA